MKKTLKKRKPLKPKVPKQASEIRLPRAAAQFVTLNVADPLLTPEEVAPVLRYRNKRAVLEIIAGGQLKAINLKEKGERKNQYRIRLSDLNAYIKTL